MHVLCTVASYVTAATSMKYKILQASIEYNNDDDDSIASPETAADIFISLENEGRNIIGVLDRDMHYVLYGRNLRNRMWCTDVQQPQEEERGAGETVVDAVDDDSSISSNSCNNHKDDRDDEERRLRF